jgi:signal transduction histidine kinase
MNDDVWKIFPFPTLADDEFSDGTLLDVHTDCAGCTTRMCASDDKAAPGEGKICRYGLTYARIDDTRLVVGVVASDGVSLNGRARTRLRLEPHRRFPAKRITHAIDKARAMGAGVTTDLEVLKAEVLKRLEQEPEMHQVLVEQLRRDFEQNVQQSHDFLQLAKLVQGHAEVLLAEKYPDVPPQDAAERAPVEGSIYFTTQLMVLKLDSLVFLQDPQRANERRATFKIHPMILKYARIYRHQASQKEVAIRLEGECHAVATYNSQAIGAVVQGILDNMVKYSPAGSDALIRFDQHGSEVDITFNSLGPKIAPAERRRIFLPGFRGAAARKVEGTGQGIGLATAQQVSEVLGLDLSVEQADDEPRRFPGTYSTTFRMKMRVND